MIKKYLLRVMAKTKAKAPRVMNERMALDFFRRPEAIGLFDFIGWSLSSSLSLRSFKIYKEPERRQNDIKAIPVFNI